MGKIIGIGVDLIEIDRVRDIIARRGVVFLNRIFCTEEQKYCESKFDPALNYAARFAVKEAVSKAFGTGICSSLSWLDMEVIRNDVTGAPSVCLTEKGKLMAHVRDVNEIMISISHTKIHAIAQAILLGDDL